MALFRANRMEAIYTHTSRSSTFFNFLLINHKMLIAVQKQLGLCGHELAQLSRTRWSCKSAVCLEEIGTSVTKLRKVFFCGLHDGNSWVSVVHFPNVQNGTKPVQQRKGYLSGNLQRWPVLISLMQTSKTICCWINLWSCWWWSWKLWQSEEAFVISLSGSDD